MLSDHNPLFRTKIIKVNSYRNKNLLGKLKQYSLNLKQFVKVFSLTICRLLHTSKVG